MKYNNNCVQSYYKTSTYYYIKNYKSYFNTLKTKYRRTTCFLTQKYDFFIEKYGTHKKWMYRYNKMPLQKYVVIETYIHI